MSRLDHGREPDFLGEFMADGSSSYSQDPSAAPVLELMRLERWRKARDAAKDLCKKDRGRYLQLLIDANVGLVREMLSKGLLKEAATVIDYLATIASAEQVAALRMEVASPVGKRQVQALDESGAAGWWAAVLRADEGLAGGQQFAADLAAIDLLVVDPFEPAPAETDELGLRLAGELAAVRVACDAAGEGRWDESKEALRSLPRQSVFWQWRLFLRGVRCVFEDEPETARQCFGQLQPGGALARAATVFGPELTSEPKPAPASAKVPFFLAATGQPAAWATPILSALTSWKSGNRVKAFAELVIAMKELFPTREPGLLAILSDALLPYKSRMRSVDFDDSEQLVKRYYGQRSKNVNGETLMAIVRGVCLGEVAKLHPAALDAYLRDLIEYLNFVDGPNPLRDSLAWQWLGETLLENKDGFMSDDNRGRKALEQAVSCDPDNEAAALSLIRMLVYKGDAKSSTRLLEDLAKRFPRNKGVLFFAGEQALERKSYAKALVSLRAALALDPLDKEVKTLIASALLAQIREAARKQKPAATLWAELEPLLENRAGGDALVLSRWMARVRRALLESNPEAAGQARREALNLAPSPTECLFFEALESGSTRLPLRAGWGGEWLHARQSGLPRWADFHHLLELVNLAPNVDTSFRRAVLTRLKEAVRTLCGTNLDKDPDGLLVFVGRIDSLFREFEGLAADGAAECLSELFSSLKKVAPPALREADPRLRLASFALRERRQSSASLTPGKALKDLDQIIADIPPDGFQSARIFAENLRKEFLGEMDEFEEDEDDEGGIEIDLAEIQRRLEALFKGTGAAKKKGKKGKKATPKTPAAPDAPPETAAGDDSASQPPKKSKPPKSPKSPPSNSNQPDLF